MSACESTQRPLADEPKRARVQLLSPSPRLEHSSAECFQTTAFSSLCAAWRFAVSPSSDGSKARARLVPCARAGARLR
eukprot:1460797-Prymnesium_polylepis.2